MSVEGVGLAINASNYHYTSSDDDVLGGSQCLPVLQINHKTEEEMVVANNLTIMLWGRSSHT